MSDSIARSSGQGRWIRRPSIAHLGITLICVLVISCIGIPLFFARSSVTLDHAALLFVHDLRYAQNEAAISGQNTRVSFKENGDGYSVHYEDGKSVANPVGGGDLQRSYSYDAIFRGVRLICLDGSHPLRYDHQGFSLDGGRYELHYEGNRRTILLTRGTGLMQIEGLGNEWIDDGM